MSKFQLSRRTFLRGVFGGTAAGLALPPLEAMFDANGLLYAKDQMEIPKRFGIFFWGNGIKRDRWIPGKTGRGDAWQLSSELDPLKDVKDYLTVITGHRVKTRNLRGHHAGTVGILSGTELEPRDKGNSNYNSTFKSKSIDQVIAGKIQTSTYKSLEVGVDERVTKGEGTTLRYLSHNGPDSFNPQEYNPGLVFNKLFGDHFSEPGDIINVDPELIVRRSILDAVREDANELKKGLSASDRLRVDEHMNAISELHTRIKQLEEATPPTSNSCSRPSLAQDKGTKNAADQRLRSRLMADLLVMATACDLTRVWSNIFSGSVAGTAIWAVDSSSVHGLTHNEGGNQPKVHNAVRFIMGEFNYLLKRLKETPEGDGNLLDHHLILGSSDLSDGKRHDLIDYPVLLAGRAGGRIRGNEHYRKEGANTSDALLTILHAMGLPEKSFGAQGGYSENVISELLV